MDKVHQTVDDVLTIINNKALQPQERHTQIRRKQRGSALALKRWRSALC